MADRGVSDVRIWEALAGQLLVLANLGVVLLGSAILVASHSLVQSFLLPPPMHWAQVTLLSAGVVRVFSPAGVSVLPHSGVFASGLA